MRVGVIPATPVQEGNAGSVAHRSWRVPSVFFIRRDNSSQRNHSHTLSLSFFRKKDRATPTPFFIGTQGRKMERFAFRAPSSSSSSRGCFGKEKIVLRRRFGTTTNQSYAARRDNKSTRGQTTTMTMIRAGFLEEAFERAQQKSSEVEETLRSMQKKSFCHHLSTSSGVKVEDMKGAYW